MSDTNHNLEVAKECKAYINLFAKTGIEITFNEAGLSSYTSRICAEKDAEIASWKARCERRVEDIQEQTKRHAQQLQASKDLIARQAEALNNALGELADGDEGMAIATINKAISASAESVAAWEAKKLEPLRREVAMLRDAIGRMVHSSTNMRLKISSAALIDTQATAEAYDRNIEPEAKQRDDLMQDNLRMVEENAELTRKLAEQQSHNNFDAVRLRRLATFCGVAVPESEEELLQVAGVVIGSCLRVLQTAPVALHHQLKTITEKAQAVIDRWETPKWKDAEPTATVIYALRDAIRANKESI